MRLSHPLLSSPWFTFSSEDELILALGSLVKDDEKAEIRRLSALSLAPITSIETLATMLGINPGLIWSFIHKTQVHYRRFEIKTGKKIRVIDAPKVALKTVQSWISKNSISPYVPARHVFGFVAGRSHILAAQQHRNAEWALSFDVKSFFQSTPASLVVKQLEILGYSKVSAEIIANLSCKDGFLAQGAPSSPVLSNICFRDCDIQLADIAQKYGCNLTRYADDLTFSGLGTLPEGLKKEVYDLFATYPWSLSHQKERLQPIKGRIKIHGLLVRADEIHLTKGYRNKMRTYQHILTKKSISQRDALRLRGHVNYSNQVERIRKLKIDSP